MQPVYTRVLQTARGVHAGRCHRYPQQAFSAQSGLTKAPLALPRGRDADEDADEHLILGSGAQTCPPREQILAPTSLSPVWAPDGDRHWADHQAKVSSLGGGGGLELAQWRKHSSGTPTGQDLSI